MRVEGVSIDKDDRHSRIQQLVLALFGFLKRRKYDHSLILGIEPHHRRIRLVSELLPDDAVHLIIRQLQKILLLQLAGVDQMPHEDRCRHALGIPGAGMEIQVLEHERAQEENVPQPRRVIHKDLAISYPDRTPRPSIYLRRASTCVISSYVPG